MNKRIKPEKLDILEFIEKFPPLNNADEQSIIKLTSAIEITYIRNGENVLKADDINNYLFFIRKGAVSVIDCNGNLKTNLDVGSWFGHSSFFRNQKVKDNIFTIEDCLFYMIPADVFQEVLKSSDHIKNYFSNDKQVRLKQAVLNYRGDTQTQLISSKIKDIKRRESLIVLSNTSIKEVAKLMSKQGRTSVLIVSSTQKIRNQSVLDNNQLIGIVTHKEFTEQVIAKETDINLDISNIMTENIITATGEMSASEALLIMAKNNIHHLPFQRKNINSYATITASDIIQFQSHNPLFLISDIHSSLTSSEVAQHSKKIPDLLIDLVRSGLTSYDITHLISSVGEAINHQLIKLAEKEIGTPPVAYAWVVAGSLARMEQTAHSDQDNALILSDDFNPEKHQQYFNKLTKKVSDGLNKCGYIYCPGNIMATNPKWQKTFKQWKKQFDKWINQPDEKALLYSSIFFDLQSIYGDEELCLKLMQSVLNKTKNNALFLSNLSKNALQFSPPLGIFRQFILENSGKKEKALDLKKRGITPIIDFVRVYALCFGIRELNTEQRLLKLIKIKALSKQGGEDLLDSYKFICSVRLMHQCQKAEQDLLIDNMVSPNILSSLEKRHLKDSFDIVNTMQKFLRQKFL